MRAGAVRLCEHASDNAYSNIFPFKVLEKVSQQILFYIKTGKENMLET